MRYRIGNTEQFDPVVEGRHRPSDPRIEVHSLGYRLREVRKYPWSVCFTLLVVPRLLGALLLSLEPNQSATQMFWVNESNRIESIVPQQRGRFSELLLLLQQLSRIDVLAWFLYFNVSTRSQQLYTVRLSTSIDSEWRWVGLVVNYYANMNLHLYYLILILNRTRTVSEGKRAQRSKMMIIC